MPSPLLRHFTLDPAVTFLNHGSFGACPRPVQEAQQRERERLEAEPVRYLARELEGRLDQVREELAAFLGAEPRDLAFVPNATTAVNAVVRSLDLAPGHELLALDQGYNACLNVLRHAAARSGARLVLAAVPFPLASEEEAVEAVLRAASPRTRLALVDHVASPTGLVLPVARIVRALEGRGVPVLVDGAHAPGMVPLDLASVGASYYAGNCHKWLCAPKGAGFLHVRRELQAAVRPAVISHGANSPRADRSRFLVEFDWVGTTDPTAVLSIPAALRFMGSLLPGGWPEVMRRNRALALEARALLASALGAAPPAPDSMVGSLAALRLPDGTPAAPRSPLYQDALQDALLERFGIEVPVVPWPAPPRRLLRISAQLYNDLGDYQRLAAALGELLG
ncbi:MAG TPA: aminotransferase class V-fold PLP-dependent enzyme [Anaeromyxobacteraceae bacterium]